MPHKIELIKGVEGRCICIDGYRIAGPKPWGGGNVVQTWNVDNLGPVETGIRASAFKEAAAVCQGHAEFKCDNAECCGDTLALVFDAMAKEG